MGTMAIVVGRQQWNVSLAMWSNANSMKNRTIRSISTAMPDDEGLFEDTDSFFLYDEPDGYDDGEDE